MLLRIEGLDAGYGDVAALRGISLVIEKGEVVSLLGSNGSGKSTLLRCISGVIPCKKGTISFAGVENIIGLRPSQIVDAGLIQVPEERLLFPLMTVRENLEMGAFVRRARNCLGASLEEVFRLFPILADKKKQKANTLSGGQQQMLAIGRALMGCPTLLMCDEPSLGLAPIVVQQIFEIIKEINARGVSIFLVEQNVVQALGISDRAYVLENMCIKMSGIADELSSDPHIRTVYLGL
jgi:branched-chain amino acid transport system ATP-binding protein